MQKIFILYFLMCLGCNDLTRESPTGKIDTFIAPVKLVTNSEKLIPDSVSSTTGTQNKNLSAGLAPLKLREGGQAGTNITNPISAEQLLNYAKTLIGTPYKYASINPAEGLDCSGFITHVFNHFGIEVPRSSVDFTNYGTTINLQDAKPGDLVLFTGTDSTSTIVGHMGIITDNINGGINFIHSTSGKQYGVTITELNKYYLKRFVKVTRIPFYTVKLHS